ncbi:MAG: Wzz/FepE/Etk N-terminal domain-containing protein, partial [Actinomycetota bacterium]|nr:Wzz/FepE/Etk N-terminal domain-containing protein [Actinomycetota bacterium]
MAKRVLEQLFGHKLLVLLPAILIPAIALAISLQTPPIYQATANVWVERPAYVSYQSDLDRYAQPADIEAKRVNELLRTRTFVGAVVARSPLARAAGASDNELASSVASTEVFAGGNHLLVFRASSPSAAVAFAAVSGLIDAYKERQAKETASQAQFAQTFYVDRLQEAQAQLAKSTSELQQYIDAHPVVAPKTGAAITAPDLDLARLSRRVDVDGADVERIRATVEQSRRDGAAAEAGQSVGFQVIDQPITPTDARRELKKMIVLPAIGVVVGLALSVAVLTLLVAADQAVRFPSDLRDRAQVIGLVPAYAANRVGTNDLRRAVGFVAGARRRNGNESDSGA